jgi:hypothetical protein
MISLFTYTSGDQSVAYLSQLFGSIGTVLPVVATTVLGTMFKTLNTTALVLGSIMVVHTTVIGLLKTAQEGEFLGKQWNSLWVPLRTVMGIAALFPTSTGYSALQVIMMWFILQGVGAADALWNSVLTYVSVTGSPYSTQGGLSSTTQGISQNFQDVFDAMVCQAEAHTRSPLLNTNMVSPYPYYYYCADPSNAQKNFCLETDDDMLNIVSGPQVTSAGQIYTYSIGPEGACGTLTWANPVKYVDPQNRNDTNPVCSYTDPVANQSEIIECAGLTAVAPSLQAVMGTMAALATTFAQNDEQYIMFSNVLSPTPLIPPPEWIMNFCTANNLSKAQCCLYNDAANTTASSGGLTPPTPTCQDTNSQTTFPPYFNTPAAGLLDYSNTSMGQNGATQKLYLPFSIQPAVGANVDLVAEATSTYVSPITAAIIAAAGKSNLNTWETTASDLGWIMAGAYYYTLAGMSNSTMKLPPLGATATDPYKDASNPVYAYRNNFEAADDLLKNQAAQPGISSTAPPQMAGMSNLMNGAASNITSNFMQEISGSRGGQTVTNPLIDAAGFGESLLITAQVIYPIFMGLAVLVLVLTNFGVVVLGTGISTAITSTMGQFLVWAGMGAIVAFCGWCITFGSMLAIYTPLIPYILFVFGALGWLIATLEAMVAAPFVALGILSPGGQHEILGRAEPAVMILLNTFLRPSLMIFGMMGGMLLAPIAVSMVNYTFQGVMGSINQNPGIIEMIVFMSAYAVLIVTLMNKCFALIYMVPDRVLTWIGGQAGSGGEAESLGAVKGATDKAAGSVKGAGDSGKSGAEGASKEGAKKAREGKMGGAKSSTK